MKEGNTITDGDLEELLTRVGQQYRENNPTPNLDEMWARVRKSMESIKSTPGVCPEFRELDISYSPPKPDR